MLSKTLDAAVQNIGLTVTENHAYGIYGGYLVTVYESGNKKTAFFNFILEEDENGEESSVSFEISEALKSNINKFSVVDYALQDDGLSITSSQSVPLFLEMIDFCTELLTEHKVKGSEYCSYCGNSFGKRYPKKITKDNKNYLLCENCTLEIIEEHNKVDTNIESQKKNNTFLGIIGAFVGGLIGIFLFFAAYKWIVPLTADWDAWDLRYIITSFAFITAFLTYLGYKLFSKKASRAAYISVTFIAVIFSAIGQYIGTIVNIATENSLTFNNFWISKNLFLMPFRSTAEEGFVEYSSDFYLFLIIAVVLAAVGSIIFLLGLYEKSKVVKEELKVETLKIQNQA